MPTTPVLTGWRARPPAHPAAGPICSPGPGWATVEGTAPGCPSSDGTPQDGQGLGSGRQTGRNMHGAGVPCYRNDPGDPNFRWKRGRIFRNLTASCTPAVLAWEAAPSV